MLGTGAFVASGAGLAQAQPQAACQQSVTPGGPEAIVAALGILPLVVLPPTELLWLLLPLLLLLLLPQPVLLLLGGWGSRRFHSLLLMLLLLLLARWRRAPAPGSTLLLPQPTRRF